MSDELTIEKKCHRNFALDVYTYTLKHENFQKIQKVFRKHKNPWMLDIGIFISD